MSQFGKDLFNVPSNIKLHIAKIFVGICIRLHAEVFALWRLTYYRKEYNSTREELTESYENVRDTNILLMQSNQKRVKKYLESDLAKKHQEVILNPRVMSKYGGEQGHNKFSKTTFIDQNTLLHIPLIKFEEDNFEIGQGIEPEFRWVKQ